MLPWSFYLQFSCIIGLTRYRRSITLNASVSSNYISLLQKAEAKVPQCVMLPSKTHRAVTTTDSLRNIFKRTPQRAAFQSDEFRIWTMTKHTNKTKFPHDRDIRRSWDSLAAEVASVSVVCAEEALWWWTMKRGIREEGRDLEESSAGGKKEDKKGGMWRNPQDTESRASSHSGEQLRGEAVIEEGMWGRERTVQCMALIRGL